MNRNRVPIRLFAVLTVAAALQACTVLPPVENHSKFFVLTPSSDGTTTTTASARPREPVSVQVGPIYLPGYLKRPEIVKRIGENQLEFSGQNRWAEPLDSNFQRILVQDLSSSLETQRVAPFPNYGALEPDYRVVVDVRAFDCGGDGRSRLYATWTIKNGRTGTDLFSGETRTGTTVTASDPAGSAALSNDVAALGQQIAQQIEELHREQARSRSAPRSGTTRS